MARNKRRARAPRPDLDRRRGGRDAARLRPGELPLRRRLSLGRPPARGLDRRLGSVWTVEIAQGRRRNSRESMKPTRLALVLAAVVASAPLFASARDVAIDWLDGTAPAAEIGVSFGVPWPRGAVRRDQAFSLSAGDGASLPLQSWTLAYWPDGSIKWTGFATVAGPLSRGPLKLSADGARPAEGLAAQVHTTVSAVLVDTGMLKCTLPTDRKST